MKMFLKAEDQKFVKDQLAGMTRRVKIIHFTQTLECTYCRETRLLLEELVLLSDLLSLEVYNFQTEPEVVQKYGIDKIPATLLVSEDGSNSGIRFYGIPSGYEFTSLLEDITDLSNTRHGFSGELQKDIQEIDKPVHIQVFVTPTCPYCPSAVRIAHRLALANQHITADMIEAIEFPHLTQKYAVRGVPKTVINESHTLEGALPERTFIDKIKEAIS